MVWMGLLKTIRIGRRCMRCARNLLGLRPTIKTVVDGVTSGALLLASVMCDGLHAAECPRQQSCRGGVRRLQGIKRLSD
jgi:hypothetical protein